MNRYAWATPSPDALRIIKEFAPIVEIGCGANAYWAKQMQEEGIDVVAYDIEIDDGGKIIGKGSSSKKHEKEQEQSSTKIARKGGPTKLKEHRDRTLFLCYPDEEGEGMGAECLEHYLGEYVIHVGESILDSNFSMDQAPWGRSSSSDFQERLVAEYHCIIKVELPNWLHVRDTISVWKRSRTCTIVFAADSDDDDGEDEDEEIEYRYIPCNERLPINLAAPCCAHLLPKAKTGGGTDSNGKKQKNGTKEKEEAEAEEVVVPVVQKKRSNSAESSEGQKEKKKKKTKKRKAPDQQVLSPMFSPPGILGIRSRERADSTDSERKRKKHKHGRERSHSLGSQSIDSLFEDSDEANPTAKYRISYGNYVTPW